MRIHVIGRIFRACGCPVQLRQPHAPVPQFLTERQPALRGEPELEVCTAVVSLLPSARVLIILMVPEGSLMMMKPTAADEFDSKPPTVCVVVSV